MITVMEVTCPHCKEEYSLADGEYDFEESVSEVILDLKSRGPITCGCGGKFELTIFSVDLYAEVGKVEAP